MRRAETKLSDDTIAKIEATGKSIYQFLQEAVDLKLNNDKALDSDKFVAAQFKEFEVELAKTLAGVRSNIERLFEAKVDLLEERMLAVINISHKLLAESIEKDQHYKTKTIENLKLISDRIKG